MLTWVVIFAVVNWLRSSYAANCYPFSSKSSCEVVDGCYWDQQCMCASNVSMDIIFTLDASSSVGSSSFQVALQWVADIIETSLTQPARIGVIRFGTSSTILYTFSQTGSTSKSQVASMVLDISYTGGNTNTVAALEQAMSLFSSQGNNASSWVNVLITDGNPYVPAGDTDVCARASQMKAMGITTLVIGVGSAWSPYVLDCLVEDASQVIYTTGYTADQLDTILPTLTTYTCPVNYNLIITEVHPYLINSTYGSRFMEFYNPGVPIRLEDLNLYGLFIGKVTNDSSMILRQNEYLVVYQRDAPFWPNCQDCACNIDGNDFCTNMTYIACCASGCQCSYNESTPNNGWHIDVVDSTSGMALTSLRYDSYTWPKVLTGYSYELKYAGYNDQLGDNWASSCDAKGTPGSYPIQNCTSWECTSTQCQLNGASNAECVGSESSQLCNCSDIYHYSADYTCNRVPQPAGCQAYWMKNETNGAKYVQFVWGAAATDRDHTYLLEYYTQSSSLDTTLTSSRTKIVTDFDYSRGVSAVAGRVQTQIFGSDGKAGVSDVFTCFPVTYAPTSTPIQPTTLTPTIPPTPAPSPSPTSPDDVYVYFSGDVCSVDRCSCNGQDPYTCTSTQLTKYYSSDDTSVHTFTVTRKPTTFHHGVSVYWRIHDKDNPSNGYNATGFYPSRGWVYFNSTTYNKTISFSINYEGQSCTTQNLNYIFNLTQCETDTSQRCVPAYPRALEFQLEVPGNSKYCSSSKEVSTWMWRLLCGMVLLFFMF